jgi:hypothetical protein
VKDQIVYRGMPSRRHELAALYTSSIGQVLVWTGFTSTSFDCASVMKQFVRSSQGILFEITLHPGAVATNISDLSAIPDESEVLIAAMSRFLVESVDYVSYEEEGRTEGQLNILDFMIPRVKLAH